MEKIYGFNAENFAEYVGLKDENVIDFTFCDTDTSSVRILFKSGKIADIHVGCSDGEKKIFITKNFDYSSKKEDFVFTGLEFHNDKFKIPCDSSFKNYNGEYLSDEVEFKTIKLYKSTNPQTDYLFIDVID